MARSSHCLKHQGEKYGSARPLPAPPAYNPISPPPPCSPSSPPIAVCTRPPPAPPACNTISPPPRSLHQPTCSFRASCSAVACNLALQCCSPKYLFPRHSPAPVGISGLLTRLINKFVCACIRAYYAATYARVMNCTAVYSAMPCLQRHSFTFRVLKASWALRIEQTDSLASGCTSEKEQIRD